MAEHHWLPRLVSVPIRMGFSSFWEPKMRKSTVRIVLKNGDRGLDAYLVPGSEWGNKQVTIYYGPTATATERSAPLHCLVKIELSGETLYFADEELYVDEADYTIEFIGLVQFPNGLEWDDEEVFVTVIDKLGEKTVNLPFHTFDIGFNGADGSVVASGYTMTSAGARAIRDDLHVGCVLKITLGPNAGKYTVTNVVSETEWDVTPAFAATQSNVVYSVGYPDLEEKSKGKPVPIVFGDWDELGDSDEWLPCYRIDITPPKFRIADHAIDSIVRVQKNGTNQSFGNVDLTYATFTLASYDPDNDTVRCQIRGMDDENGILAQNPAVICKTILKTYLGQTDSDLSLTSFTNVQRACRFLYCRRWIGDRIASDQLLTDLANECNFDRYISGGKHVLKFREPAIYSSDVTAYDQLDHAGAAPRISEDPERLYINDIHARLRYSPAEDEWHDGFRDYRSASVTQAGGVYALSYDFKWLYQREPSIRRGGCLDQAQRWLFFLAGKPHVYQLRLGHRALALKIGQELLYSYTDDEGNTVVPITGLQVREISKPWPGSIVTITAWDLLWYDPIGRHQPDSAPNYNASSSFERKEQGYWCDADGLAEATDPDSDVSRWY